MKSIFRRSEKNTRPKHLAIKTFTYFIPSPPSRQKGYREKEFDKLIYDLTQQGHDIISLHTQALSTEASSGMWVICQLGALTPEAAKLDLEFDSNHGLQSIHPDSDFDIEGN